MGVYQKDDWYAIWKNHECMAKVNPAQQFRRKSIARILLHTIKDIDTDAMTVADFGCGTGDLLSMVHTLFPNIHLIGFDLSSSGVAATQGKIREAAIYKCNLLLNEPSQPSLYGAIDFGICSEVLEHVDDPSAMLATIRKYIRPEGKIVFTVPAGPMNMFEKSIGHRRHYIVSQLTSLLEKNDFSIIKKRAMGFPFFNLYKCMALLMGTRVLNVADSNSRWSFLVNIAYRLFSILFTFNLNFLPWGWQTVILAKYKG